MFTADKGDAGRRVDLVTRRHLADLSRANRTRIQHWIADGRVRINGTVVMRTATRVAESDAVSVDIPAELRRQVPLAEAGNLDILYEDSHLLIVNKPAGIVSHPTFRHPSGSLLNHLLWHSRTWPDDQRPSLVGRLDKQTSGLVVVAKSMESHARLQRALGAGRSEKDYLAVVRGPVSEPSGRIRLRLRRDPRDRRRVVADPDEGLESLTLFERIDATAADGCEVALLRCRLMTGRMHQIRVHLSARGWPIVGDSKYGCAEASGATAIDAFPRQALHAWRVAFEHPFDTHRLAVEAPLPADMRDLVEASGLRLNGMTDSSGSAVTREMSPPRQAR